MNTIDAVMSTRTAPRALRGLRTMIAAQGWPLLPLRLLVGFGFAAHGYAKLARGPAVFAGILSAMGIPAPVPMAWATSLIELVGGISIMLGAAVAPLSLPLVIIMSAAAFGVHSRYGFSSIRLKALTPSGAEFGPIGYELNLLYIASLIALALGGSGPFSFDGWIKNRRRRNEERQPEEDPMNVEDADGFSRLRATPAGREAIETEGASERRGGRVA
jgi:putative oxidoreductase